MNQGKLEVVKQEMARVNINILGISNLKWTGMDEFNSDDHCIYYCGQESLRRNGAAIIVNKRVLNAVKVKVAQSCPTLCYPMDSHQAPLSMGLSRQEYWSGLPLPSPGDLPNPGTEPRSPALQADALTSALSGKPLLGCNFKNDGMISVHFQGKAFSIMVIQVYTPTSNAEEAEVEWFYEDLQGPLELTPKKMSFL